VLLEYLNQSDAEILDVRGESLNLFVVFECILSLELSFKSYVSRYISHVNPKVAITFIDNNPSFYQLKNARSSLVTIFVQNGVRSELGDIFGRMKGGSIRRGQYGVDYMLTFGIAVGDKYCQYVEGRVVPIGSLKNNFVRSAAVNTDTPVLFLSQYKPPPEVPGSPFFTEGDGTRISWEDFFSAEQDVLRYLKQYCGTRGICLRVCGRAAKTDGPEYAYFERMLGNTGWQFIPRSGDYSSYEAIDRAEVIVFVDSTLGYESLARGKKTAAFCIRGKTLRNAATKFGWPADLPDNGPFWTNQSDEREFARVMNYLATVSDDEWENTRQHYMRDVMDYDPGNTRFIALLQRLGVPLNEERSANVQ